MRLNRVVEKSKTKRGRYIIENATKDKTRKLPKRTERVTIF